MEILIVFPSHEMTENFQYLVFLRKRMIDTSVHYTFDIRTHTRLREVPALLRSVVLCVIPNQKLSLESFCFPKVEGRAIHRMIIVFYFSSLLIYY